MAQHETQYLIVANDQGDAMFTLINNHGPESAEAVLYGVLETNEIGWIDRHEQIHGNGKTVVLDLDLQDIEPHMRNEVMKKVHRIKASITKGNGNRSNDKIDFFADDDRTQLHRSINANSKAKMIHGPPEFAHARFDLRGNAKT